MKQNYKISASFKITASFIEEDEDVFYKEIEYGVLETLINDLETMGYVIKDFTLYG